jgi:hypothetical protein
MFGLRRSILSRGEEWGGEDEGDGEVGGEGQEQGLKVEELAGLMERIRGIRGKFFLFHSFCLWGNWRWGKWRDSLLMVDRYGERYARGRTEEICS